MIHLASTAKSKILENWAVPGRSITKMRGPRILPHGTPERTGKVPKLECLIDTYCTRLAKLAFTHDQSLPVMPKFHSIRAHCGPQN